MQLRLNYILIPALVLSVMVIGGLMTDIGMECYETALQLPLLTPPKWVFSYVWTSIYVCCTVSLLVWWNRVQRDTLFWCTLSIVFVNACAHIFWTYLFFVEHAIWYALIDASIIAVTALGILLLLMRRLPKVGLLWLPYVIWSLFAVYLNYLIVLLN